MKCCDMALYDKIGCAFWTCFGYVAKVPGTENAVLPKSFWGYLGDVSASFPVSQKGSTKSKNCFTKLL